MLRPMKPIPLLDFFGSPLLAILFGGLFLLQWKYPLRRRHFPVLRRMVRNFVMSAPSFVILRLALIPIPLTAAAWAQEHGVGLLHWLSVPGWIAAGIGFLAMDWVYYWWHFAMHKVPVLWRFHNVHHTDLDMDVTTAARFHFGEIVASIPFRVGAVVLFGITPLTLLVFELVFEAASLFHHSNWRLPIGLERVLNRVIVTPRMHGTHHSIVQRETDSNWGTIFSWWDRLHRSLRIDVPQGAITIGVAAYRDEGDLTAGKLLLLPFQGQRPWALPNGETPRREPVAVREMAE
jgi:sterol desaturase/sphingolipid hydroxylase (fatty acid hydroxylase superfamily)